MACQTLHYSIFFIFLFDLLHIFVFNLCSFLLYIFCFYSIFDHLYSVSVFISIVYVSFLFYIRSFLHVCNN